MLEEKGFIYTYIVIRVLDEVHCHEKWPHELQTLHIGTVEDMCQYKLLPLCIPVAKDLVLFLFDTIDRWQQYNRVGYLVIVESVNVSVLGIRSWRCDRSDGRLGESLCPFLNIYLPKFEPLSVIWLAEVHLLQ